MFDILKEELQTYTKNHFGEIVYEYVFKNNHEKFLEYAESADFKVETLENKIVELFRMNRTELEEMQLLESSEESSKYVLNKRLKEDAIFSAKEQHIIIRDSADLFEYGSTMRKVLDDACTRAYHNIESVKKEYQDTPFNFSFSILDYKTYRDKKIKQINNEIEAIKSGKRWTFKHIETITKAKLVLESISKKASVFKFEVIPLTCEKSEYELDVIKYVTYANNSLFPGNDAYNAVYEGTEFYHGCAADETVINTALEKLDINLEDQIVKINSDFNLRVTKKV